MAQDDFGLQEPARDFAVRPGVRFPAPQADRRVVVAAAGGGGAAASHEDLSPVAGAASWLGFRRIHRLVDALESVLGLVREDRRESARGHGPLRAVEQLQELVEHAALCSSAAIEAASPRLLPPVHAGATGRRR